MTEKQKQVFLFISEYIKNNGFTPSYQEMCDELGIKSKSHIHNIVKNLEQQGYIQSTKGKKRSISIVSQNKDKKIKKLKAENQQLKELLISAKDIIEWYSLESGYIDLPTKDLLTKIDNAIGEKK
jgi:DNA-binding transcriptional regulator YhcF (GntR family)